MAAMTTTEATPFTGSYRIDPVHSSVAFAVGHLGVSLFRGAFGEVDARLAPGDDGRPRLEGSARVDSITITEPPEFRAHVLGDEFFDAESHPEIGFRSEELSLAADGSARLRGRLTIRGATRELEAHGSWSPPAEDPFGMVRAGLRLDASIDRRDFGLGWQMARPDGGNALDWEVALSVQLELTQEDGA
jgi:polyisoprenoid-binding protein YceI